MFFPDPPPDTTQDLLILGPEGDDSFSMEQTPSMIGQPVKNWYSYEGKMFRCYLCFRATNVRFHRDNDLGIPMHQECALQYLGGLEMKP